MGLADELDAGEKGTVGMELTESEEKGNIIKLGLRIKNIAFDVGYL